MPVLVDTVSSGSAVASRAAGLLTIGLVNNMPDAAVEATERQFVNLIGAAAPNVPIRLLLFTIPQVARAEHTRRRLAERYRDISQLWDTRLDGLIVTGTEPRATDLSAEPYWPDFTRLVDWAGAHTRSTFWSCLAAHGAVLHADGIERQPREHKLFGVFSCERIAAHPLLAHTPPRLAVPHSRYNDLPRAGLAASGCQVLTRSADAGVDTFVRRHGTGSLFVFLQGHPEYEADTLAREYRRDVARFLRGERERFPETPQNYFDQAGSEAANAFRARALNEREQKLIADFPMHALEAGILNTWNGVAVSIYANWIKYLKEGRADRQASVTPLRRPRLQAWRHGGARPAAEGSKAG